MAAVMDYLCRVDTNNEASYGLPNNFGITSYVTNIEGSSTASSNATFFAMRRGDTFQFTFSNAGTSSNKLVVTPLGGFSTSTTATTVNTGEGNNTQYTIKSTASLGDQTSALYKLDIQNSSGTSITAASGFSNPSYVFVRIDPAHPTGGTTHNFTVTYNAGSLKQAATVSIDNASGTAGESSSSILELNNNDIIRVTHAGTGTGEPATSVGSTNEGYYGAPDIIFGGEATDTNEELFTLYPPTSVTSGAIVHEYGFNSMTTGGNEITLPFGQQATFTSSGATNEIHVKNSGDGLPNVFSNAHTSSTARDTYYTMTQTVGGLSAGAKALFSIRGAQVFSDEAQVKVGSGDYRRSVLAGNGDVLTFRAKSSPSLNFGRLYYIIGMQGDGQAVVSEWTLAAPTLTDATYGMEFYKSNGDTLLSINDQAARFVTSGQISVTNHGDAEYVTSTVSVTGMTNDSRWRLMVYFTDDQGTDIQGVQITSVQRAAGSFSVTTYSDNSSNADKSYTVEYVVVYSG